MSSLIEALGAERVLEPPGALPQAALRLDATMPMQPYEIEIGVDTLCVDLSSFRQLVESNDHDPVKVGEAILRIVSERGKMYNPVTGPAGSSPARSRRSARGSPSLHWSARGSSRWCR